MRTVRMLLFAVLLCSLPCLGQEQPKADKVTTEKREKIIELIKATGAIDTMFGVVRDQIAMAKRTLPLPTKAQDDFETEFLAGLNADDLANLIVPVYETNFEMEDIDSLLAFYKTPLGMKLIAKTPEIAKQSAEAGRLLGMKIGRNVGEKIGTKLAAGEYGPWQPPAAVSVPTQK